MECNFNDEVDRNLRVRDMGRRVLICLFFVAVSMPGIAIAGSYVPSEVETALLTIGRQDDVRAFAAGQESYAAQVLNIDVAIAQDIAQAYESKDDGKANHRFLNRRVLVSGIAAAVWPDGADRAVLVFADTGATQVRAIAHGDQASRMATWHVGSKVALVCTGEGGTSRAASFDDCENAGDVARREWERLDASLADFYQGKHVPNVMIVMLAINIAARASRMPTDHRCAESLEKCRESATAIGSLTSDKGLLKEVVQRFEANGLDLSVLAPVPVQREP
ncbi:OB-fold protein [Cupriavidus sp. USMAHM13]|uniref:OB-fold protein n=1 Tax=Cupriavidus sp. USMAHM13 TaxID=1389192 RepID=UPI0009F30565|nr:hypothetical protein [Cupriavidus sp. USMAHM13]